MVARDEPVDDRVDSGAGRVRSGWSRRHASVRVGFVDVDEAGAKTLVGRVREQGHPEPLFVPADVRDVGALQAAVRHVGEVPGPVSVLVNDAANDQRHDSPDVDAAYGDDAIAVNLPPLLRHPCGRARNALALGHPPRCRRRSCGPTA